MKKLYYSVIILLVAIIALVMPKVNAAGEFDYTASYIGFIDSYERDSNGNIVGAYVYITDSSLEVFDYDIGYYFNFQYFQLDIVNYGNDLIGKSLIWNRFDDRGAFNKGAWWLLIDYQQMLEDFVDRYYEGYYEGLSEGYYEGMNDGKYEGYEDGLEDGYSVGYEDGEQLGYADGYSVGYSDGYDYGREQTLNSIENIEILYQDVVLPNGVKDEILDNEILVDRVGEAVFDGLENWVGYRLDEYDNTIAFRLDNCVSSLMDSRYNYFISNILDYGSVTPDIANRIEVWGNNVYVRLSKSDLLAYGYDENMTDQQKVNAFKQWLVAQKDAGEPLKVWYQYSEPVEYDLVSLLRNEDGSFRDGYSKGYSDGRVTVQRENKSLLSVIPTTIGAVWLMISDFLSYEVFGLNLWSIIIMFASFSLLVLIIKMVI